MGRVAFRKARRMTDRQPAIAKGDRIEVVAGQHRGATGEAFAVFPRVRDPRVMVDIGRGRIVSVPVGDVRKIGSAG